MNFPVTLRDSCSMKKFMNKIKQYIADCYKCSIDDIRICRDDNFSLIYYYYVYNKEKDVWEWNKHCPMEIKMKGLELPFSPATKICKLSLPYLI